MSKPLATKVSTPLSENVQIGPKVSIFCVATIILLCTALTLPSTFRLRMPHRCSIGFRSGDMLDQSITFTLSFFSKAVVILEVCLGSFFMLEYCPAAQSPKGRGSCSASVCHNSYMLAFMVPSMNCSSPLPAALMQPQTMTLPPPCLTVGKTLVFVLLTWLPPHTLDTI